MSVPTDATVDVIQAILNPSDPPRAFAVHLSQFRDVYQDIQRSAQGTPVDIVLNGDWAMAQFSGLCNHRIRIIQDPPTGFRSRLVRRRVIAEKDLDFASLNTEFYGAKTHLSFHSFLAEEISRNWIPLLLTLLIAWAMFMFLLGPTGKDTLEKVNELVLTSATLYLSIFLLFTVSQNVDLVRDSLFFRQGLTQRFFRVDQLLAFLAVVVLFVSILNIVLLNTASSLAFPLFGQTFTLPHVIAIALTGVGIVMLMDCFLAFIGYYFHRLRYTLEKELAKELLDEIMEKRNQQKSD